MGNQWVHFCWAKLLMYGKHGHYAEQKIVPIQTFIFHELRQKAFFALVQKKVFSGWCPLEFPLANFHLNIVFWRETVSQLKDLKRLTLAIPSDTIHMLYIITSKVLNHCTFRFFTFQCHLEKSGNANQKDLLSRCNFLGRSKSMLITQKTSSSSQWCAFKAQV